MELPACQLYMQEDDVMSALGRNREGSINTDGAHDI